VARGHPERVLEVLKVEPAYLAADETVTPESLSRAGQGRLAFRCLHKGHFITFRLGKLAFVHWIFHLYLKLSSAFFNPSLPPFPLPFILGVLLSSVFYTLLGFIIAARAKNLNEYFVTSLLCTFIVGIPVLDFFNVIRSPLFYLFPTKASLLLIHGAFKSLPLSGFIYAIFYLLIWSAVAYYWAYRRFTTYVILKIGGRR